MREHPPEYDIADREKDDDIIARGDIVSLNGREVKVYDFEEEIVYVNEAGEPSKSLAVYHYFIDDFSGGIDEVPKQYVQSLEVGNFLDLADDY